MALEDLDGDVQVFIQNMNKEIRTQAELILQVEDTATILTNELIKAYTSLAEYTWENDIFHILEFDTRHLMQDTRLQYLKKYLLIFIDNLREQFQITINGFFELELEQVVLDQFEQECDDFENLLFTRYKRRVHK